MAIPMADQSTTLGKDILTCCQETKLYEVLPELSEQKSLQDTELSRKDSSEKKPEIRDSVVPVGFASINCQRGRLVVSK